MQERERFAQKEEELSKKINVKVPKVVQVDMNKRQRGAPVQSLLGRRLHYDDGLVQMDFFITKMEQTMEPLDMMYQGRRTMIQHDIAPRITAEIEIESFTVLDQINKDFKTAAGIKLTGSKGESVEITDDGSITIDGDIDIDSNGNVKVDVSVPEKRLFSGRAKRINLKGDPVKF